MKHKILIADSNVNFLKKVGRLLSEDFNVLVSITEKQTVLIAKEKKPDFIITPFSSPQMNGGKILKSLHKANIPFLFIADKKDEKLIQSLGKNTKISYLLNPLNIKDLKSQLDSFFTLHGEVKRKRRNIMVVDDIDINRNLVELFLATEDVNVIKSSGGLDSLEKIKLNKVDLILLDIEMPDMNGWETLKQYKKLDLKIPVIALSAHGDEEFKQKCLMNGFSGIITKPISKNDLINSINDSIKIYSATPEKLKKSIFSGKSDSKKLNLIDLSMFLKVTEGDVKLKADTFSRFNNNINMLKQYFSKDSIADSEKEIVLKELHTCNNLSSYFCKKSVVKQIKAFEIFFKNNFKNVIEKKPDFMSLIEKIQEQLEEVKI